MDSVPEFPREDRVVAFDGCLREGLAGHGKDGDDLVLEQELHGPGEASFHRGAADRGHAIVHFDEVGYLELPEEFRTALDEAVCRLGFNSLKKP